VFKVSSRINSTWGGGLTDMVRSGRFLEIVQEDRLVDNARVVGDHLLRGLSGVQADLGGIMSNARGRGLMIAFDLPTPELRKKAQDALGPKFDLRAFHEVVLADGALPLDVLETRVDGYIAARK